MVANNEVDDERRVVLMKLGVAEEEAPALPAEFQRVH